VRFKLIEKPAKIKRVQQGSHETNVVRGTGVVTEPQKTVSPISCGTS
jgi:hypothetical protein